MMIPTSPLPPPSGDPQHQIAREIEWLHQEVEWETLEDLPPREAAAQITLWVVQWRRLEARIPAGTPEEFSRARGRVLRLILAAIARYPGRLPRIPVLARNTAVDFDRELSRARELLADEAARRRQGGWKEDLLIAARDLRIDLERREDDEDRKQDQAADAA